ncbi:hypothetical protein ACFQMH_37345 [Streptomyces viridiviolaceus]|uniref:Secreted protein n=1 Tax=Streptomyces viridiviolaceus TaxID=68282 RepID=A0ABW2EER9_9ACTN|nr:hypothetical protein [Streptomyces viridiviolaceus]
MKKRSMLALASLATGFVVAAVTPSHAQGGLPVDVEAEDTVGAVESTVLTETLPLAQEALDHRG